MNLSELDPAPIDGILADVRRHEPETVAGLVTGEVAATIAQLGADMLAFLREHAPDVDSQPELGRLLADGTLERHLAD